jgi:DNA adenine methylase
VQPRRPFLKWAGAKTKLLEAIRSAAPPGARRLIEPFAGSGAVALNLDYEDNLLADANPDLIAVYRALQRDGPAFIERCTPLFSPSNNVHDAYYALRQEFNATTNATRKAALFVYLNRHGYNGLCRYNRRGQLNVPFGRYVRPRLQHEAMQVFHDFLQRCEVRHADFRAVMAEAGRGDFVYCDPPYVPASATANFTSYAQNRFGAADQIDLAECARAAVARGAWVVISNHDGPETRELYRDADSRQELLVQRRISCVGNQRTPARELLVVFRPRIGEKAS